MKAWLTRERSRSCRGACEKTMLFVKSEHGPELLAHLLSITGRGGDVVALEVMDHLAQFYLGPGQKYPTREVREGLVLHAAVERIYGRGHGGRESKEDRDLRPFS